MQHRNDEKIKCLMNTTFKLEFLKIFKKVSITKTNSYSYK